MSTAALVIVCVIAGLILVAVLAAVMLAPTRLGRPFADGFTHRQWAALRARRRARSARRHRP